MRSGFCFLALLIFICSGTAYGQQTTPVTETQNILWLGYFSRIKVAEKWGINSDVQWRRNYDNGMHVQDVFRTGINYKLHLQAVATVGIAFFRHHSGRIKQKIIQPEWRPWQQLNFVQDVGRFNLSHRFRFEQRVRQRIVNDALTDDFDFNYRIRYRFNVQLPINKKKIENNTLFLDLANEVMLNFGKEIETNYFDQNRIQLGLSYKLNENYRFQLSYMQLFATTPDPFEYRENHIVRFNFYHNLNLQKTKQE